MISPQQAWTSIMARLKPRFGSGEAGAMTRWIIEDITATSLSRARAMEAPLITPEQWQQVEDWVDQLLEGRPFHYVLGYQLFRSRRFRVNESVLIPRPETEELVTWILEAESEESLTLWDLGTGSGCIPITLKAERPTYQVFGADISQEALELARANARDLNVKVTFLELDIGDFSQVIPPADLLVSNPPYIPRSERGQLEAQVRDHEPSLALFVPDEDPLLFYRWLAKRGMNSLRPGGRLYLETHRDHAEAVQDLLMGQGYEAVQRKDDFSGHPRMVRALRP